MLVPKCNYSNPVYRYGFQGQEKDNEIKGIGNSINYKFRMHDPRVGRFFAVDPLAKKYPWNSPYVFVGNNPILFVDYDGRDFGIKINHTKHTIIIVANIYTTSADATEEALRAVKAWNNKTAKIDGYTVSFQITVVNPVSVTEEEVVNKWEYENFYKKNKKLKKRLFKKYAELLIRDKMIDKAMDDPIGNSYASIHGHASKHVSGEKFVGGYTANCKRISMNVHKDLGNLARYKSLVTHEIGHLFGLDDKDGNDDGKIDPYYPGDGGIMEYKGLYLNKISNDDVKAILNFAKDELNKAKDSKVHLLENTGKSDGKNPIGVKNN